MPLDFRAFRKDQGGDPDKIRQSQKRRYKGDEQLVDKIIQFDKELRNAIKECDAKNKEAHQIHIKIREIKDNAVK